MPFDRCTNHLTKKLLEIFLFYLSTLMFGFLWTFIIWVYWFVLLDWHNFSREVIFLVEKKIKQVRERKKLLTYIPE